MTNKQRKYFRQAVFSETNNTCLVPWCDSEADDAHQIIERPLWTDGGYIPPNGAAVCNNHHQYAETNDIPPQAFWLWKAILKSDICPSEFSDWDQLSINHSLPEQIGSKDVNKWGDAFDTPPWKEHRDRIKYPSSRHLLPLYWYDDESVAQERIEHDDTGLESIEDFIGIPLVVTEKTGGSNCMVVNDVNNPVRARNGKQPLETMKPLYGDGGLYWEQQVNQKLPDRFQVFGEWLHAKHSIHYGCDCESPCEDVGPSLSELTGVDDERAYFQVFGVYDKQMYMWLSWPMTQKVADDVLGFPTSPVIYCEDSADQATFETKAEARRELIKYARDVIDNGGEGIVVRTKFPIHYGQFGNRLGKYVRENHVKTDEHWSHQEVIENNV
ncbi:MULTISPECIES: RNA ligase family protein [Natrialbaceae]|uniref:RNA ligase family protein n=1 Tax=Natrialbaceae TaxID=1644061 RepID=UPI00207C9ECF|nr:RNA ligase family protein [Natronococcus sp. CG52]